MLKAQADTYLEHRERREDTYLEHRERREDTYPEHRERREDTYPEHREGKLKIDFQIKNCSIHQNSYLMDQLKKAYRKSKLEMVLAILEQHTEDWKITLDENIKQAVFLLQYFGFSTVESCEGHLGPEAKVNTFRLFWPYVKINLIHKTVFHFDEKKPRIETVNIENPFHMLRKLEQLTMFFTTTMHPYAPAHDQEYELSVITMNNGIGEIESPLHTQEALKNHWSVYATVCDVGVRGILSLPQELLGDTLRKQFLQRTRYEMKEFTKFLKWYAIEHGTDSL